MRCVASHQTRSGWPCSSGAPRWQPKPGAARSWPGRCPSCVGCAWPLARGARPAVASAAWLLRVLRQRHRGVGADACLCGGWRARRRQGVCGGTHTACVALLCRAGCAAGASAPATPDWRGRCSRACSTPLSRPHWPCGALLCIWAVAGWLTRGACSRAQLRARWRAGWPWGWRIAHICCRRLVRHVPRSWLRSSSGTSAQQRARQMTAPHATPMATVCSQLCCACAAPALG